MDRVLEQDYNLADGKLGNYKIISIIGMGANSIVYDAEYSNVGSDIKTKRIVKEYNPYYIFVSRDNEANIITDI